MLEPTASETWTVDGDARQARVCRPTGHPAAAACHGIQWRPSAQHEL